MIILFWVLLIIFLCFFIFFIIMSFKMKIDKKRKRWGRVISNNLNMEKILINDSESNPIICHLYRSKEFVNYNKMPGVIILPRWDKKYPFFEHWGAHFALQGYPTLCVDIYNKKLKKTEFIEKYRKILPKIKERFCQEKQVKKNHLIYFGIDRGAEIVLLEGLPDDDVKVICGISMHLVDENKIKMWKNSEKVYLVHCRDDKIVNYGDFEKNMYNLGLKDGEFLVFNYGGHYLLSSEHSAAAFFSIKINQKINPKYEQIVNKKMF